MAIGALRLREGEDAWVPNVLAMLAVGFTYIVFTRLLGVKPPSLPLISSIKVLVVAITIPLALFTLAVYIGGWASWHYLLVTALIMVILDLVPALAEELGWRRYLTGLLFKRWDVGWKSFLLSGLLWGAWHSPLLFLKGGLIGGLAGLWFTALHGIWIAFLYWQGGLVASTVYHAFFIGLRDTILSMENGETAVVIFLAPSLLGLIILIVSFFKRPLKIQVNGRRG